MKTYSLDQLRNLTSEEINDIQRPIDLDAQAYADEMRSKLSFLRDSDFEQLKEYYTDTMEKYRLIYKALVHSFQTNTSPGYPEFIYNINLKDGNIETNKNGRRCQYFTRHLAPCNTSMLHYINNDSNDVFIILPPIKSIERSVEKLISECYREFNDFKTEKLNPIPLKSYKEEAIPPLKLTEIPKMSFEEFIKYGLTEENKTPQNNHFLLDIAKYEVLPKDIYRLTVTSKHRSDIRNIIKNMERTFPEYIKFEKGERNLYEKDIKDNPRYYFDIKKTAQITIPGTKRKFYIEFQFKQNCIFFSHIRSHKAYEDYRELEARYNSQKEALAKRQGRTNDDKSKSLQILKKQMDKQKLLCISIHKSGVHQSNLNLMHKIAWLNENAKGLNETPNIENVIRENYIVESEEPFDGATAFTTNQDEYLNKCYYLKLIEVLPENFDEFGKNAKNRVMKEWGELSETDLADFASITTMAIKYLTEIRELQKRSREKHKLNHDDIIDIISDTGRN